MSEPNRVQFFHPDPKRPDGGNFLKLHYDGAVVFIPAERIEHVGPRSDALGK